MILIKKDDFLIGCIEAKRQSELYKVWNSQSEIYRIFQIRSTLECSEIKIWPFVGVKMRVHLDLGCMLERDSKNQVKKVILIKFPPWRYILGTTTYVGQTNVGQRPTSDRRTSDTTDVGHDKHRTVTHAGHRRTSDNDKHRTAKSIGFFHEWMNEFISPYICKISHRITACTIS